MNRKWLMSITITGLLLLSMIVFGLGCFEANAVNAMSFQSVGVIGLLTVLHLKSR